VSAAIPRSFTVHSPGGMHRLEAIESIVPPVWAGDTRDKELAQWS
jgi:hypothetical protein